VKAKTPNSRKSAYQLLLTLCSGCQDNINSLLEKGYLQLLNIIPNRKKYAYLPSKLTKTFYGFVGLKNLGCICYMNAMLQQFYMTPQFRYAILMADDKIEPNIITSEKWGSVDDNTLHQL